MRYYPLNRVKTNQRAVGDEFTLNGVPYKGYYYSTYDGQYFTGRDPIQGLSQKLQQITTGATDAETNTVTITSEISTYRGVKQNLPSFQTPQPYYPRPTDTDYQRGSIMRYFAKKRNQPGFIIEIDKETHDSLKTPNSIYDYITYEAIDTLWQITGPLRDNRTAKQYKIAGIIDTNKRLIEAKEAKFPGLVAYIGGDYAKFAKPTG